jgi:hypothetical protein
MKNAAHVSIIMYVLRSSLFAPPPCPLKQHEFLPQRWVRKESELSLLPMAALNQQACSPVGRSMLNSFRCVFDSSTWKYPFRSSLHMIVAPRLQSSRAK